MQLSAVPGAPTSVALKDAVLVMPAVAFANVGELAVDVLVASLSAQLVARLDTPNLLACVGNNAYQPQPAGLLATAAELYHVPGSNVLLLQQRAPAIPGRQQAFASELAGWAASAGVRHVLLLCGLDAQYRREQQLEGPQLRYLPAAAHSASAAAAGAAGAAPPPTGELSRLAVSSEAGGLDASCASAGLLALEGDVVANERELHGLLPPWPLLDAAAERGLACTLLATFAAEGDNAQDGLQLAAKVVGVLSAQGLLPAQQQQLGAGLKTPCSWGPSLFGRQGVDSALF